MCKRLALVTAILSMVCYAEPLPELPVVPPELPSAGFSREGGWYFLPKELDHLKSGAKPDALTGEKNPIPAIKAFHEALEAKGIRLYVLPVPEKSLIRVGELVGEDKLEAAKGYGQVTSSFIEELKKNGVNVVDVREELYALVKNGAKDGDPVYCKTDSHYTPETCRFLGTALAKKLQADVPNLGVKREGSGLVAGDVSNIVIKGDLAPAGSEEHLRFHAIQTSSEDKTAPVANKDSPVLLLGDSHCLIFHAGGDMLAKGGGLPDHLGLALGSMPDVMAVKGSGATSVRVDLYRKARKDTKYLAGKKVVIWCFAAREFTQAESWKVVPLP